MVKVVNERKCLCTVLVFVRKSVTTIKFKKGCYHMGIKYNRMSWLDELQNIRDVVLCFSKDEDGICRKITVAYINDLRKLISYCKIEYDRISAIDIRAWFSSIENLGYKNNSIITMLCGLKFFYRYYMDKKLIK